MICEHCSTQMSNISAILNPDATTFANCSLHKQGFKIGLHSGVTPASHNKDTLKESEKTVSTLMVHVHVSK